MIMKAGAKFKINELPKLSNNEAEEVLKERKSNKKNIEHEKYWKYQYKEQKRGEST